MKLTTYISAGVFIFMSAVVIRNSEAKNQSSSLYETKWSLRKIHTPKESFDVNGKAFISFHQEKQSAGGNGGCNAFGSTLSVSGNSISFSDIFSTKMYCEEVQSKEDAYFSNLSQVNRYEIKGGTLSLYNNKSLLLEFVQIQE